MAHDEKSELTATAAEDELGHEFVNDAAEVHTDSRGNTHRLEVCTCHRIQSMGIADPFIALHQFRSCSQLWHHCPCLMGGARGKLSICAGEWRACVPLLRFHLERAWMLRNWPFSC